MTKKINIKNSMLSLKEFPVINNKIILKEAIEEMSNFKLGVACVIDANNKLEGIITDGDIRRIVINNQDVCTSASSVAVQTQILGFATGQTVTDENCERLKLARSLYGMGMKVAAVSVLCQDERVWEGMWMAGTPCPYLGTIGKAATEAWKDNDYQAPTIESLQKEKVKEVKEVKKNTKKKTTPKKK